ncbi:PRC-barrel domain-containing protein [Mariniblastus fucicola]|uniref:PRC-barrel domain protein n=1 Tax=Mariniblastus fucicola TaxID=980251 RepID=A0A5B9PB45_9BACT|nr:PRC-barrel domain-containing protein [Mariniblastus fucicola]QEG20333.1 PRC-barrel domain protein [Mariniblastus fucicola]
MTITTKLVASLAICALTFTSVGLAQETEGLQNQKNQTGDLQLDKDSTRNANRAGNLDPKTVGSHIRASQLMGRNIENNQGEDLGEVHDIVLDARTGKIGYVCVTYGGLLGIGNDLHAVPFEAFKFSADPDDRDETILVLNVTQEQMEGAKGFTESTWPNFADKRFTDSLGKRYGTQKTHTRMKLDKKSKYGDRERQNKDKRQDRDNNDR